jgi:hypothetical protein
MVSPFGPDARASRAEPGSGRGGFIMPRAFGQPREDDPRSLPSYTIPDAARYLLVPPATVRSWVAGRPYPTQSGVKRFSPVIVPADSKKLILSFVRPDRLP